MPGNLLKSLIRCSKDLDELLDDTLLHRLETCIYCEDSHHGDFWKTFDSTDFLSCDVGFDEEVCDSEYFRGITKLRFAILWHLRNSASIYIFEDAGNFLTSLILAEDMRTLSGLYMLFDRSCKEICNFQRFKLPMETILPHLHKLFTKTNNINHRKIIIKAFVALYLQCFCTDNVEDKQKLQKSIDMDIINPNRISLSVDFYTQLLSECRDLDTNQIINFLRRSSQAALRLPGNDIDTIYLQILLSPFLQQDEVGPILEIISSIRASNILRRLIISNALRNCSLHRALVDAWVTQLESGLKERDIASIHKDASPLSTVPLANCPIIMEALPSLFVGQLHSFCVDFLSSSQAAKMPAFRSCWLLFSQFSDALNPDQTMDYLKRLLNSFKDAPETLGAFPFLLDSALQLYRHLPKLEESEHLGILQTIFDLSYHECLNLSASGGSLSYTFLLLKCFEDFAHQPKMSAQLMQLQTLVSLRIAEDPSLISNETVITIHRGLFVNPLLATNNNTLQTFTPEICDEILRLVSNLKELRQTIDNDQMFSLQLKATLLACLLRCFANPSVIMHLHEVNSYEMAINTCINLFSIDFDEDPSIRSAIMDGWRGLQKVRVVVIVGILLITHKCT